MKLSLVRISALSAVAALTVGAMSLLSVGCSDDTATTDAGTVILKPPTDSGPTTAPDTGTTPADGGTTSDSGACSNKPAGCFCGTPSTQKEFLNRCTTSVALPFSTTFKAGTAADLP